MPTQRWEAVIIKKRKNMKKNLFYLFALICSMSLFTSCSNDDDPDYTQVIERMKLQVNTKVHWISVLMVFP